MPRKPSRPEPFKVTGTNIRVRVSDGPRKEDGRWYWRADYQDGDKRPTVWSGWATQEEAERLVLKALAEPQEEEQPAGAQTVQDLLELWTAAVDAREDVSDYTKAACTTAAKRLLKYGLGAVQVERLGRQAIERHRDAALRMGAAGSTVQRELKHLRAAWTWGREVGVVPDRDLPRVRVEQKARKPVYTDYTPTREEIGKILAHVRPEWIRRSLILLSTTGARIGEIATLTWEKVAADCTSIEVEGKTGPRRIPLHPTVAAEVRRWTRGAPEQTVLGKTKNTAVARTQRELARVSEQVLKIPRVSPNGLRRAMTDALYEAGVGPDVEMALLGHSPQTALTHYRRVQERTRAKAIVLAGVALPEVPTNKVLPFPGTGLSENLSEPASRKG